MPGASTFLPNANVYGKKLKDDARRYYGSIVNFHARGEMVPNEKSWCELDPQKNSSTKAQEAVISSSASRVKVLVIPTNEELVVAREVKRFLEKPATPGSVHGTRNTQHATRPQPAPTL